MIFKDWAWRATSYMKILGVSKAACRGKIKPYDAALMDEEERFPIGTFDAFKFMDRWK